jgi:hypothetical protein
MPKPYWRDLRERVVRAVEAGASCPEAAAAFAISPRLEQCLVPTLSLGEIVSIDNLFAHNVAGVRR